MKLAIEDEAGTRSIVPFAADAIVVGRGADGVTFRLADRNVSRRHARFVLQNGTAFVEDLGSLTGTRVNGDRITGRRRLREGDLVQIGDYDLAIFGEEAALDPGAPPPLPSAARVDPDAPAAELPAAPDAMPATTATPAAARSDPAPGARPLPSSGRGHAVRLALAVGAVALAAGVVAGWVVGALIR